MSKRHKALHYLSPVSDPTVKQGRIESESKGSKADQKARPGEKALASWTGHTGGHLLDLVSHEEDMGWLVGGAM